ncbi:OLC1v1036545C1 [Oldenlandia corymbosa var. corymbosa]|uniref:OLC1v1036545C1 n=1 Tax=Oldenlandia corymbosa var. corymbosa TaxID=529605 RepID=A0AAV1CVK5_OLDCO|nr:OLC1v1036545C1 [Oldenlandia corymbosa var. corymbosa]
MGGDYAVKFDTELAKDGKVKPEELLESSPDFDDLFIQSWPWPVNGLIHNDFVSWENEMEKQHAETWKKVRIYNLMKFCKMGLYDNKVLLGVTSRFWRGSSNTFCLPWGMITLMLLDVAVITGLPMIAEVTEDVDLEGRMAAAIGENQQRGHGGYIQDNCNKDPTDLVQHIRFLALWLNWYIICDVAGGITKCMEQIINTLLPGVLKEVAPLDAEIPKVTVQDEQAPPGDQAQGQVDVQPSNQVRAQKVIQDPLANIGGPMTRSQRKKMNESLNNLFMDVQALNVDSVPWDVYLGMNCALCLARKQTMTVNLLEEDSEASDTRVTHEQPEKETNSSPWQRVSPQPSSQKAAKKNNLFGRHKGYCNDCTKLKLKKFQARYRQELKKALTTIKGSDLPDTVKGIVGLFLANFEQRKISCKICIKHVHDYNHAAMAHQEAELMAKILVEQAVEAARKTQSMAEKHVALEQEHATTCQQRIKADEIYSKTAQQSAVALKLRDSKAVEVMKEIVHYANAQPVIAKAAKMWDFLKGVLKDIPVPTATPSTSVAGY